jgi:hypothetical protein
MGPRRFFVEEKMRYWSIFDFIVVSLGVYEIPAVYSSVICLAKSDTCLAPEACGGGGVFAVLRLLRLIRFGKFLEVLFPNACKQLEAIASSVSSIGALMMLVLLFIRIFLILGMHLFGGVMTTQFDSGDLNLGAHVFVELSIDPWAKERPMSMPGRRGVIIDVDPDMRADAHFKVEVWKSRGLWKELRLVPCHEKDISGTAEVKWGCVRVSQQRTWRSHLLDRHDCGWELDAPQHGDCYSYGQIYTAKRSEQPVPTNRNEGPVRGTFCTSQSR